MMSSGISLAFLWYVAKNLGLFSRLIYFRYGMTALEEEYPSWWLASQTRKALRQMTASKSLSTSYPSLAPPRIQNTTNVAGAAGAIPAIAAGSANPVGFIVGPIIAGAVFTKWVYDIYRAT
jgi:hypothetical protein